MSDVVGWLDEYFWGAMVVLRVFGVGLVMAVVFGLVGAAAKLSKSRIAESLASAFTVVFRGTPELLVLLIVYFGSAVTLTSIVQTFVYVRIPQMWRLALPNFGNHMLSLMKDTALISVIGLEEIVFVAEIATTVTVKPFTMYFVVALIYLAITTVITLVVAGLEKYANRHLERAR